MLGSANTNAQATAARQIAVASFHEALAQTDLAHALAASEHSRAAIANVFSSNIGNDPVRDVCSNAVMPFFNDEAKSVRNAAADCFRNLSSEQLAAERELIYGFIESRAFEDGCSQLTHALETSTALLPDVICAIPEKMIARHLTETPDESIEMKRDIYQLPELVIRLYEQTHDSATRTRCLDVIDSFLKIGFSSLDAELQKVER